MTIHLNNKKVSRREIRKIFTSIQDNKVLKSKGGFLFKSSVNRDEFHLGIIPVIIDGQRTHHYDIKLNYEDIYIFSGFFNSDGTLGILFTPPGKKENITIGFKTELKSAYSKTLSLLVDNGISDKMELDWISRKMIEEIGIFDPIPRYLKDFTPSQKHI
jgi:hypothetical protein